MSAPIAAGEMKKICKTCGADVNGQKRIKDVDGKYLCAPCAEAGVQQQRHAAAGLCEVCGESFSASQLITIDGKAQCARCRKRKYSNSTGLQTKNFFQSIKSMFGR
jgi:formylmethanofuran dehydrogenase subunit E